MSELSRRTIVTSAAALPALAVPALASSTAIAAPVSAPPAADIIDRAGMVARAKQIVDVLSESYVCEGWHESFDRQRAAQFVESVRRLDPDNGECEYFRTMLGWMRDHGQSLDWLIDGDASVIICRGAAAVKEL